MLGNLLGTLGSFAGGNLGSAIGGSIGGSFGAGILSRIGRTIGGKLGSQLGDNLEGKWFHRLQTFEKFNNLRESFAFVGAKYGAPIPLPFGRMRVQGKIIWLNKMTQHEHVHTVSKYFRGSKRRSQEINIHDLSYSLSFAIAICEGKINEVSRVWNGDELINIGNYKHRIYHGLPNQMPDPLIRHIEGDMTPAFRDLAYIVFEEIPLGDFNDTIPNLSFEITRRPNIDCELIVEDMVKSMIMIPGSGEYVYDTIPQEKTILSPNNTPLRSKILNVHNQDNIADATYSLNQLQSVCHKVEWVAPVVCWFGSSDRAGDCRIRPAIEFNDPKVRFQEAWQVGVYDRFLAPEISKDEHNFPNYGGSVNDASVIRYLEELRRRQLKIMLYPMFFVDIDRKPWRGRVTGSPSEVARFFTREQGYNEFILHYAKLAKGRVDAFIIGTELIGLTKVRASDGSYPAVDAFINLAQQVKAILGPKTLVTYAADWSEYHHTDGGWYNLDPLWACEAIDFIGIDAYFPITDSRSSIISDEDIRKGFTSGEGYDYYVDWNNGTKHPLDKKYAWKNLRYWWENKHVNPDGTITAWIPKSKKIWFTEYGFPSIDKAPNQPNVFYDPKCLDGGVPRHSNGEVNFSIQRRSIKSFIEYWQQQEFIDNMFLWTWDARPYPAYPHMDVWTDSYLWEKGHWVNNKFGAASVAAILLELSKRAGIPLEKVNIESVDESINGMLLNSPQSCLDAINTLRSSYFFDIKSSLNGSITFIKRGTKTSDSIAKDELIKLNDNSFTYMHQLSDNEILSEVNFNYIDSLKEYETSFCKSKFGSAESFLSESVLVPLSLSHAEAERISNFIILNARCENMFADFILPLEYITLRPTDYISIQLENRTYSMRLISTRLDNMQTYCRALLDEVNSYSNFTPSTYFVAKTHNLFLQEKIRLLELPFRLPNDHGHNLIAYVNSPAKLKLTAMIADDADMAPHASSHNTPDTASHTPSLTTPNTAIHTATHKLDLGYVAASNTIGQVIALELYDDFIPELIDERSTITVSGIDIDSLEKGKWHIALIGTEIVRFEHAYPASDSELVLRNLVRGEFETYTECFNHTEGEDIIILNGKYTIIPLSEEAKYKDICATTNNGCESIAKYSDIKGQLLTPYHHDEIYINDEGEKMLKVTIAPKYFAIDSWRGFIRDESIYYKIILETSQTYQEFECEGLIKIINISAIDLSLGYQITILANR